MLQMSWLRRKTGRINEHQSLEISEGRQSHGDRSRHLESQRGDREGVEGERNFLASVQERGSARPSRIYSDSHKEIERERDETHWYLALCRSPLLEWELDPTKRVGRSRKKRRVSPSGRHQRGMEGFLSERVQSVPCHL